MKDLITLYTPELMQAFVTLTALLFGANILQAIATIIAKGRLQETECRMQEAEDGKQAALDMLKHATDKAKKVQAERDMANELRDRCEKTMRAAMEENDRLLTERASLYFRNAKGQIQKLS
jgi:biopolymer transport protein ExbB/TolQ